MEEQTTMQLCLPGMLQFTEPPALPASFGCDNWANYGAEACVTIQPDGYAEVAVRSRGEETGIRLRLYGDGRWTLTDGRTSLQSGTLEMEGLSHRICIRVIGELLLCAADAHSLCECKPERLSACMGGIMLTGEHAEFTELSAQSVESLLPVKPYCSSIPGSSPHLVQEGIWVTEDTAISGTAGASFSLRFRGSGIYLMGRAAGAVADLWLDGRLYAEQKSLPETEPGEVCFALHPLHDGSHTLRLTLRQGSLTLETVAFPSKSGTPPTEAPLKPQPAPDGKKLKQAAILAGVAGGVLVASAALHRRKKK